MKTVTETFVFKKKTKRFIAFEPEKGENASTPYGLYVKTEALLENESDEAPKKITVTITEG